MFLIKHESNNLRLLCHKTIIPDCAYHNISNFSKVLTSFLQRNFLNWGHRTFGKKLEWSIAKLLQFSKKRLNDMDKSSQQVYFQTIVKIHSIVVTQPTISYKLSPYHNCKRNNNPPLLYWYDEELRPLLGCFEDICSKSTYLFLHKKRHWKIFSKNFFLALQH